MELMLACHGWEIWNIDVMDLKYKANAPKKCLNGALLLIISVWIQS